MCGFFGFFFVCLWMWFECVLNSSDYNVGNDQWIYVERHTSGSSIPPGPGWPVGDIPFAFAAISSRDALFTFIVFLCVQVKIVKIFFSFVVINLEIVLCEYEIVFFCLFLD